MKDATEQGLQLLDKVTEFRFSLVLLSVAVALDAALAWGANRKILTMDWSALDSGSIAMLGLAVVAYVFWMAALSRLVRAVVESALAWLGNTWLGSLLSSPAEPEHGREEWRYASGRVRVKEAKLRALKDKDTFWMGQVEKAEARERDERSEMAALAGLSFSLTGLLLIDWWSDYSLAGEVVRWLGAYGGRMGGIATLVAVGCVLLIAFPWLHHLRRQVPSDTWMDHPELAEERLEAIQAQRRDAHLWIPQSVQSNVAGTARR